jgi:hypothetical protein
VKSSDFARIPVSGCKSEYPNISDADRLPEVSHFADGVKLAETRSGMLTVNDGDPEATESMWESDVVDWSDA